QANSQSLIPSNFHANRGEIQAGSSSGNSSNGEVQTNSQSLIPGNFHANSNADYRLVSPNRSRSSVTLFAKGEAVATNKNSYSTTTTSTSSGNRSGTTSASTKRSYFGTDMIGSVRSSTHDDGLNANYYDYDVFGKPFGEINDYGYVGKPYDPVTGLSNYGYRDYSPKTARFTTVDPIRDGHNWYAYCSNDPVNFVDLWGLEAGDKKYVTGVKDTHVIYPQYVFAEGEGFLGSYTYDIYTSVKNSNNGYTLNVWAVATSGPQSRHDDIQYFGSVNLNVNGKKVESKQLTQIGSYVINSSSVMVGEASFSLPQNGEVSVTIVNTGYSYNGAEGTTVVSSTKKHTIEIEVMK
ncbi:MAG TPA: RHS repeat-associated core domain-containing protein, partial [Treponemataceae bacterium]|nr:RHS repeat-associated core domain-containing protein [Treponemataceae bacterium]